MDHRPPPPTTPNRFACRVTFAPSPFVRLFHPSDAPCNIRIPSPTPTLPPPPRRTPLPRRLAPPPEPPIAFSPTPSPPGPLLPPPVRRRRPDPRLLLLAAAVASTLAGPALGGPGVAGPASVAPADGPAGTVGPADVDPRGGGPDDGRGGGPDDGRGGGPDDGRGGGPDDGRGSGPDDGPGDGPDRGDGRGAGRCADRQNRAAPTNDGLPLQAALAALARRLQAAAPLPAPAGEELPRVYGWISTPAGRRRVKCLLDSGATHCFVRRSLAEQLPGSWSPPPADHPAAVRQADGSSRVTAGSATATLSLGALEEPTQFVVYDVDCDADLILGYTWLRSHDLAFLYEADQICFCAERGCTSGRRIRLDVVRPEQRPPAAGTSPILKRGELFRMLSEVGLGPVSPLSRPYQWSPPTAARGASATLSAAATDAWALTTLATLAEAGTTLQDGTELYLGTIAIAAEDLSFALPSDAGDPPEFAALAAEYGDVLGPPPPGLPPDRGPDFELHIETGTSPMPRSRPMKRWSQGELDECRKQVAHLLDNGWIRPSRAAHAASVVFARKADGSWRFCQDYRGLNAITQRSVEPLPHVDQLVDETRGARFFTKLDLASAYHQFRIREADQFKTSFRVPGGQFEFRVGAFGLHGMSSLLMRYMHAIFGRPESLFDATGRRRGECRPVRPEPMLGRFVQVYMDDILIFSKTKEEHLTHVRMVLETLRHHKLFAKASKCQFCRSSVGFLGHIISEHGVGMDPRKVAAVAQWARPTSCTEVRRFVGLANYYRRFVLRFSNLAAPLTTLCSPRASFRWGPVEQQSFDALKAALTSAPVLRVWDPARPTRLITDASELAVSAILEQPDDAGAFHPVAFESRKLTAPERTYPPHLLELLAVVQALKSLRPYLLDRSFELHTDNASLTWRMQQRTLSHHQARWLNLLAEYQFRVVHIPGRTNPADFLTRQRFASGQDPAPGPGPEDPDSASSLELFSATGTTAARLPAEAGSPPSRSSVTPLFVQAGSATSGPLFLHTNFAAAISGALASDPVLGPLALAASSTPCGIVDSSGVPPPPGAELARAFVWRSGLLYRRSPRGDRLCIPADPVLRQKVLQELHATPLGGHFGRDKTLALARRTVWWPALSADLDTFIRTCPTCQRVKAEHGPPAGLLYPLPVPSRRGGAISLDFVELPKARSGHDFLQVHIDLLTGRVWLVPTFKTATSADAAANFISSVFRDVGLPDVIVSDRDTRFTSGFWTSLHAALGSSLIFGSPHHHNTTSKVERVNGVLEDVLRSFVGERGDDWPALVPLVEFAINDSASPLGTGYTPFYADRGQHPRRPLSPPSDSASSHGEDGAAVAHLMSQVTEEVRALLQERQDARKARLDVHRRDVQFAVGDEVLLDTTHTPLPSRSLLSPRWMGPFKVVACTAPNTYRLDVPATWRAFNEFNVSRLRRYQRRPAWLGGDPPEPSPVIGRDGSMEHVVQEILKFRRRAGHPQVLIRWAGHDASGDTWEPLENLTNCEEAIHDFERARGCNLPRPPPAPPSGAEALPLPPAGFTVDPAPPTDLGAALVGRSILYLWPADGWQRGSIARVCPPGPFSHVVAYHRQTSALRGTADSLLDAASYGTRWVLLSPEPPTGVLPASPRRRRAPRP